MTHYWMSTKSPVHMFKRIYESLEVAEKLIEDSFVDAAILSQDMRVPHMNRLAVAAYQRRLGVRKITGGWPARKAATP